MNNKPAPRGVIPYGNTWGHIDLLEQHYGDNWREEITKTLHWKRIHAGENMRPNRGSVFWAICTEYRLQHGERP